MAALYTDDEFSLSSGGDDESDFELENAHPNMTKQRKKRGEPVKRTTTAAGKKTKASKATKKTATKKTTTTKRTLKKKPSVCDLDSDDDDDEDFDMVEHNDSGGASSSSTSKTSGKKKTVEEIYQKKSQLEHILLRPDTYIGSVERIKQQMYILSPSTKRIIQKEIEYTPGLFKIFDEIIVNAADNKQRDPNMDSLMVEIDGPENTISVKNNGKGIPVVMHKEHKCYVPTLIFGHLLTGSNFDDDEKKTTGGRNGYGAKLANIFSTEFIVECVDVANGLILKQHFRQNMNITEEPIVKPLNKTQKKGGDYTKITFKPDLKRFKMTHLDEDIIGLFSKRAYDIAGSMANKEGKRLVVTLNKEKVPVRSFETYLKLYDGISPPVAYEKINDRWEVGVGSSDGSFQQVSFVNAICTSKGGGHTEHIANQVANSLTSILKKKTKGGTEVKKNQISNHLCVFVNCLVENPTFDSQTKEFLTTRPKNFASCKLSASFLKKVEKSEIVQNILAYSKFKDSQALKKAGGKKKTKLTGIAKLDDANFAGSAKSKDCTLIITEGDSAKSLAMSGISVVGRDYYGVFPLKGKPLNVREATHAQIMKNEEIKNVVEILGLKFGVNYDESNIKTLRYGHLMIMADQDHDGSHIKGLVINFIHHFWPSLLDVPGFLQQFITPIVKATKGKKSYTFFTLPEYEEWRESIGDKAAKSFSIKYYKGLGTSTSVEAKEYFANLDLHEVNFSELSHDVKPALNNRVDDFDDDEVMVPAAVVPDRAISGNDLIAMAFTKNRVDDRKIWLNNLKKGTYLNYSMAQEKGVCYSDFINKELILFSQADNQRSIPHIYDGFKPSQRKVLFSCFKRKLKNEIKVAQLAGYVSEHSAYHHGEMSLNGTIVGMAQSFCGSNNVNLLTPSGQFGTRRMGGKDAASPRYIFTKLEKVTRTIFHPDDDALLSYLTDDGLSIEPEYYMPVIPMILVNGSDGIGTGWSSFVPNYCPRQIISNLRKLISGEKMETMSPSYSGFSGEVNAESTRSGHFEVRGQIERFDDTTLKITELPVKIWTQNYKVFLESLLAGNGKSEADIKDFKEDHTDTTVSFTITATKEKIDLFERGKDGLYGKFKLLGKLHTTNMNLFDELGRIIKYQSPEDIMTTFFSTRLDFYGQRKDHLLMIMRRDLKILSNKARFVLEVCNEELIINNRKRKELLVELQDKGYDMFDEKKDKENESESDDLSADSATDAELARGYEYLLGMKIWNLTFEKVEQLRQKVKEKEADVIELEATPPSKIWENDLDAIEEALNERDDEFEMFAQEERKAQKKNTARRAKKVAKSKKAAKKKKKQKDEWDSDLEDDDDSLDGRNVVLDSDSDDFMAAKSNKKPIARSRRTVKKVPDVVTSKNLESSSDSKMSDVEVLSDSIQQRLTVSPAPKKPSLAASIDSFLAGMSPSKGKKRLTPTKESNYESEKSDDLIDSPVKKVAPKKKPPAKRAKAAAKPKAKTTRKKKEVLAIESSDEDIMSIVDEPVTVPTRSKRSTRATKKTNYADLEDTEESEASVEFVESSEDELDFR